MRALLVLILVFSPFASAVELTTPSGKLLGAVSQRSDAISVFKGIPYAIAPTGVRRWTYAEAHPGWKGVRDASRFSPACVQHPYPENSFFARSSEPNSEDCLYLNVWSSLPKGKNAPVMVWIHGGALTRGSGSGAPYDGTELAKKGVVLVTINYRLGVFGYMAHPELSAETASKNSGNYGTSDQIQALHWIKDNIAAFGGDPNNVTIFGESAGSWSVNHLVASPEAKGLFHRAIGQSGGNFRKIPELKSGERSGESRGVALQSKLNLSSVAAMRQLDAQALLLADDGRSYRAIVDGKIIPAQLYQLFEAGNFNQVPVMLGYNAEEGTTLGALQAMPDSSAAYKAMLRQRFGQHADDVLALYPSTDVRGSVLALSADTGFGWNMHYWASKSAQHSVDAFLYYFTHQPLGPELGAFHAAEIVYAFNNVQHTPNFASAQNQNLADQMSSYWVNFATNGDPNGVAAGAWPRYSAETKPYLEFASEGAQSGSRLMQDSYELFEALYQSER
jgi:para-nitrobenzyl esterase